MLARKCDICGALYEQYTTKFDSVFDSVSVNGVKLVRIDENQQVWGRDAIDCCPECMAAIIGTINERIPCQQEVLQYD